MAYALEPLEGGNLAAAGNLWRADGRIAGPADRLAGLPAQYRRPDFGPADDVLERDVHDPLDQRQQLLDAGGRNRDRERHQRDRPDGLRHLSLRPVEPGLYGNPVCAAVIVRRLWADLAGLSRRGDCGKAWLDLVLGLHHHRGGAGHVAAVGAVEQGLPGPDDPPARRGG